MCPSQGLRQGPGFPRLGAAPGTVDIALPPLVPVIIALPPLVLVNIALPCVSPGNLNACMRIISALYLWADPFLL